MGNQDLYIQLSSALPSCPIAQLQRKRSRVLARHHWRHRHHIRGLAQGIVTSNNSNASSIPR